MSPYSASFITKQSCQNSFVRTTDLTPEPVLFSGKFSIDTIQLPDVMHVPRLAIGLVSLTQLMESGLLLLFNSSGCVLEDPKQSRFLEKAVELDGYLSHLSSLTFIFVVYKRFCINFDNPFLRSIACSSRIIIICQNKAISQLLANSGLLGNITSNEISCLSCKLDKHHALSFELNDYTCASAFDLIHSDVWDQHHIHLWVGVELPQIYITYACMIRIQFSKPIKILRADNAMEYKESSLIAFLRSQATLTAVYTINRHPTPILHNKSSYEVLHGVIPKNSYVSLDLPSPVPTPNSKAPTHVGSPVPSTHIPHSPAIVSPEHVPVPPTPPSVPSQLSTSEPSVESTDHGPSSSVNDVMPLPPGKRPIGSKWVFKIKTKPDDLINRYKACLVAKGFNQEYGIDYEETFASVARVTSVCSLLAIAAMKYWLLFQMDFTLLVTRADHYAAVLRILRYLKGTMFHDLFFSSTSLLTLRGFFDADWNSDITYRRSTKGYCFVLGDSLIFWRSKKQSLTSRSSIEAECRALTNTSQELIRLRWLLCDMVRLSSHRHLSGVTTPVPLRLITTYFMSE
ncbi:hypothetical protein OSB04_012035 [Centaurea solstitialis]|uniref:Reverse transcriptase Ty1/copia-type domain-containing protein n=1 Tax=Centaurea solstitialis TaxID=347529 RepID=A0AA38WQG4_9ASTR|nr:hypothetical protein OSB04_012035 [Centaurea solstitialis]